MARRIVLQASYSVPDREEAYYRYLDFEVAAGEQAIQVDLSYDRDQAILDLGLFGPSGFRGWSGGERSSIYTSERWATPGYLPGPLEPGRWSVILGLYVLPHAPVEVSVEVTLGEVREAPSESFPPVPQRKPALRIEPSSGWRWVPGDLHCHSLHSDGKLSLAELAALAAGEGLFYLAVTDHNTISHHQHLPELAKRYGICLVAGQEVTTPYGHANCWGEVGWVDFREPVSAWAEHARTKGGLLSINHPVDWPLGWQMDIPAGLAAMEVWHQSWDRRREDPIKYWRERAPWAHGVGGSDFHRLGDTDGTGRQRMVGAPTTWVEVPERSGPPEPAEVLLALKEGRVAISAGPAGPLLVEREGALWAFGAEGCELVEASGRSRPVRAKAAQFSDATGPAWLVGPEGEVVALCGPLRGHEG